MAREKKAQIIDHLEELISKSSIGILVDYRGLSATEITALRRKLGEANIQYRVVKNTLARFAMERAGKNELLSFMQGPISITSSEGEDVVEVAKVLTDYINSAKLEIDIRGGFTGDKILTKEDVITLSKLPSREILLASIVGGMQSPIYGMLNCLVSPLRGFTTVLQARIQQLEGE